MQTLDDLTASFAIPGVLDFDEHHGLLRARIHTPACTGEIYLYGAHVTLWQPTGADPVLFLSETSAYAPGAPIRGGIPLVFPWFGKNPEAPDAPVHGFARTQPWKLDFAAFAAEELHLSLTLEPTDLSRSLGYDRFLVALQITFGPTLKVRLSIANDSDQPVRFEEALHTYLHVGDVTQARVHGLFETDYLDKPDNFARKTQRDPELTFTGLTDRVFLNTTSPIVVDDPVLHRRLTNSNTTVVWNPWANHNLPDLGPNDWRQMLCIESANAIDNALTLAPHTAHVMETTLSVEPLTPNS